MTDVNVIENKISAARKYLKILEGFKRYSQSEIAGDITVKGALERYLYLAVQAAIDLAEAIIAYKKWRKPSTMGESFLILSEEGLIDSKFAKKLSQMVGFRNIIAHDYEEVDSSIVHGILHSDLKDIEKFIDICSRIH